MKYVYIRKQISKFETIWAHSFMNRVSLMKLFHFTCRNLKRDSKLWNKYSWVFERSARSAIRIAPNPVIYSLQNETIVHAYYVCDWFTTNSCNLNKISFEILYEAKPKLSHLKLFGNTPYTSTPEQNADKTANKRAKQKVFNFANQVSCVLKDIEQFINIVFLKQKDSKHILRLIIRFYYFINTNRKIK